MSAHDEPRPGDRPRVRPQSLAYPRSMDLDGVVLVVVARSRRGALARCLEGLRESHEAGARVVYVDDESADGSVAMVRERFPFVRVAPAVDDALRPASLDHAPPRFVAHVAPDAAPERRTLRALVRAVASAPRGTAVEAALCDPGGRTVEWSGRPLVWVARRRDLVAPSGANAHGPLALERLDRVRALVPRPDALPSGPPSGPSRGATGARHVAMPPRAAAPSQRST
ncbi:MAG: hypothetical protein AAGB93_14640 [Planctomycetota bacterium]